MKKGLEFDAKNFNFRAASRSAWGLVHGCIILILTCLSVIVLLYAVVAPLFNTGEEKRMKREIREMEKDYRAVVREEKEVAKVITGLQYRDARVYDNIFHSDAPNVDPMANLDCLFGSDTIPDSKLVTYASRKADELEAKVKTVETAFHDIFTIIQNPSFIRPPMVTPVADFSYMQVGAGEGKKMNPFYKAMVHHRGLDIIVPHGTPVLSVAEGVVVEIQKFAKGHGNTVVIEHPGGWYSSYCHLSGMSVTKGRRVHRGDKIGAVGMTGITTYPHLHFEMRKDSLYMNPVNFFFCSVSPEVYANMLFMSANTLQSMD